MVLWSRYSEGPFALRLCPHAYPLSAVPYTTSATRFPFLSRHYIWVRSRPQLSYRFSLDMVAKDLRPWRDARRQGSGRITVQVLCAD